MSENNGNNGAKLKLTDIAGELRNLSMQVAKMEGSQIERHQNNRDLFKTLFNKTDMLEKRFDELACDSHEEKFRNYDRHINTYNSRKNSITAAFIGVSFILLVQFFLFAKSWGVLNEKINSIINNKSYIHDEMR